MEKALDTLDKLPIYIQDKASATIEEVQAMVQADSKRGMEKWRLCSWTICRL
ncbi:hypothetical protein P7H14_01885 [Paenibacillus larvae]|nr:hypothetical protein [Paenibacillus larvae]